MTHQNHQTNGASLEDCHTNFFALTELYGIKWRKLVWGESSGCEDEEGSSAPLSDPVISSYARCLAGDILCVWRRVPALNPNADPYEVPAPAPPPPLSLKAAKELWIFWYGEEPDLTGLVAPELMASQGEQGSWESGLSYECRSLLFKALHNLIERCLLSRDFVRLGKWFVQPYDGDEEDVGKSPWHLSFSFAFFLHGESTVCASVDVRQHPPVRTLTAKRLAKLNAPEHRADNKVILAPFGLEGTASGRQWADSDAGTARLLEAWRQLYPLEQGCSTVEVVVEGVRMRYPAPYVLVTEMESASAPPPPPAPAAALARRTAAALTTPAPHQPPEVSYADPGCDKGDDFLDPTRKTLCTCAKWRRRRGARPPPFHRRHLQRKHQMGMAGACSPGSCGGASPAPAVSAPSSAGPPPPPSPHPPSNTNLQGGGVPASLHTPAPTPDPLAPHTPAPPSASNAKLFAQGDSPPSGVPAHQNSFCTDPPVDPLKRPVLRSPEPKVEPQDDDNPLSMLYNYDTVYAWLEHPVKRFKSDEPSFREELALGCKGGDLYAGHDHTKMAAIDYTLLQIKQEKQEPEDTKEYKNLFTSDGLYATLKDLDQIFDNSDETSGDETLAVQTPPDSNKSVEDIRSGGRCVRPEELSKMFPTPPSMEAHAQPSPGCPLPDDPTTALHRHSPPPDPIEDWSYVFKPPTVCKYVGSSKYAPLSTLPSQLLPPVTLPPHAVYRPRWQRDSCRTSTGATKRSASPASGRASAVGVGVAARLCGPGSVPSAAPSPAPPPSAPPRALLSPPPSPRAHRNACPLLVNVLLADTVLNVFRDHNFDSCTLCVCNAGNKTVGNIRGADAAVYLPGAGRTADDEPSSCSCGFSAIVNRRLAHRAGLFYEDEMEITGVAEEPTRYACGPGLAGVAGAVLALCSPAPPTPANALARAATTAAHHQHPTTLNLLEYSDGGCAASIALRAAVGERERERGERMGASSAVHRWPFIGARAPRSSRDVVRLMRRLRPLLQDAIQKRCCGARMWDGVTGPLTWRQFHRLAGRGNEDLCEPQPVPKLLVGHDKDWLTISPYALRHWERLSLEPYSYSRDVAYVVLAPDGDVLTDPLRTFFKEVSTAYESCRLGRHQPIGRLAKEGLFRSSPSERDSSCEEWTGELPPGRLGEYIKAYAEVLRNTIVPQLANLSVDKTLFETENKSSLVERAAPSPMRPPSTPDHPPTPSSQSDQEGDSPRHNNNGSTGGIGTPSSSIGNCNTSTFSWEEDETVAPSLVLYIVEPPAAHAHKAHALHSLLRLSAAVSQRLQHHNPLVKLISLESVCEWWGGGCRSRGEGRALAFSVFTSARRLLQHNAHGKSLTGFGTAAHANLILQAKDEKNRAPYKLFSPLWVLAPGGGGGGGSVGKDTGDTWGGGGGGAAEGVLYVSYCLSHDQRWLHATASDARGELLHANTINIHVPNRSRRRRGAGARRLGLTKLMDWTLGVMSQSAQPWRLVIGRVGRIGHGELKGWSWLLSKKNLVRASTVLREICASCSALHPMYPSAVPCILSACLVSTEPDSCLRLMADRFTPDERFSQASIQSHLHTPRDVTATHILVFPTSATATQSNQSNVGVEEGDGFFLNVDMGEDEDGVTEMLDDMFNIWPTSPRRADSPASRDGSPRPAMYQQYNNQDHNQEQVGTVLQQPLALGYMVSTAPLGSMPAWWWAGSTHLRDACPAFLKNALHLHAGSVQSADDFTSLCARRDHNTHPLDSPITTDVLRYVLEGYNAMSWLALDGNTHDRVSCLPLHVQVLMQLYHTAAALG